MFDAFYRTNPSGGGYAICAGVEQVIEYIENLHFDADDINYLRGLHIFDEDFLAYLADFHFPVTSMPCRRVLSFSHASL